MNQKKYKFIFMRNRRKWSRRGSAIADFICSIIATLLEHLCHLIIGLITFIKVGLLKLWRTKQKFNVNKNADSFGTVESAALNQDQYLSRFKGHQSDVCFEDIAGLDEAKREINLRMIMPFKHPEKAIKYNIRRGGGLLLYGPPGTGKTMLAKAVSNELNAPFFRIRPSDIITGQVGQAEQNISRLFEQLRTIEKAVLFIDEIEAFVPSRKKNGSTIMQRVISQILSEIDGFETTNPNHTLFIIGATNEITMIDRAMLRPGRFDTHIYVGPPDPNARRRLLQNALASRPVSYDIDMDRLIIETNGMTGAEINEVINKAADSAFMSSLESNMDTVISAQSILRNIIDVFDSRAIK